MKTIREYAFRLGEKGFLSFLPDEMYVRLMYWLRMGYPLNLCAPQTFNEKLQWRKLRVHDPSWVPLVDKLAVKEIVAQYIGETRIIPTLGVWEHAEDIDFSHLPETFVLKCTHDSGSLVICRDRASFDTNMARAKLARALKRDFYRRTREWPYRDVPRRIICEPLLVDPSQPGGRLTDYKFYCFHGKVESILVCTGRMGGSARFTRFDRDWNVMPGYAPSNCLRPPAYETMLEIAELLARNMSFVRVDLYNVGGEILFGELTLYPKSGWDHKIPSEIDCLMGLQIGDNLTDGRHIGVEYLEQ